MTTLRDRLPAVPRGQYDAALRERDDWERRARQAAQRATDARRAKLPPAARRSVLAVAIVGTWLVIVGIFVGGAAIPHHDDRPVLTSSTDVVTSLSRRPASLLPSCSDTGRAQRSRADAVVTATACPTARATSGGSRTQPPRQPQPD
jgi:hypothetical protein